MYQIKKLLFASILALGSLIGMAFANSGTMSLTPTTGSLGMRCVYPINFYVNVDGASVKAMDMRVIYSGDNVQFTGEYSGSLSWGSYSGYTGLTTNAIDLGWVSYVIGSQYRLFNRFDYTTPLTGSADNLFYKRYFQTLTNTSTGYLDFYFSGAVYGSGTWNGDDSNIQSGVENNFIDILSSVNSGYYNFIARPCILDVDPALFTGYASGETISYLSGIIFTIYDFTGEHDFSTVGYDDLPGYLTGDIYSLTGIYRYNNTIHYRWTGGNYVPADNTGIDNQYGVNSGTIQVSLSGTEFGSCAFTGSGIYSGGNLVYTSFNLTTYPGLFTCSPILTSVDKGYFLTWSGNDRGYDCSLSSEGLVGASGVQLDSCQTILVTITGADNINFNNQVNTGSIIFSLTITGIDNTPPYIVTSFYNWTGAYNGFNTTGAGPLFSAEQNSGWELWTKDDVEINLTGNKIIIMSNVVGFSGTDLNIVVSGGNGYSGINQTLIITGNMSGFVTFQDIANSGMNSNYGQTYATGGENYVYDFNIDVFWIDRITTELTGYLTYTGENGQNHHATLTLTGFATGYDGSIKDDEFIVYAYSGVDGASNSPDVTYITGYIFNESSGYNMYHSGIVFNDNWTGYILYRDRANNTGEMYVNITGINKSFNYTIIAVPSNREDLSSYVLSNSGVIARFTFVSGYSSSSFTDRTGEVVFSGLVKTSSTGIYTFDYGFTLASGYTLIFESQTHISAVMTGIEITGSRVFDFTTIGGGQLIAGDLLLFQPNTSSLTTDSIKDGEVNASDIGAILAWVQMTGGYQIYSGGFHVRTGSNFVPASPLVNRLPFVQYHPGDINADGDIKSTDIAIINNYLENRSVRTRSDTTFFDIFD